MREQSTAGNDLTLKQKISWVLLLVALCALPLGYVVYQQNQTRIAAEKQRVALVAKQQVEDAKVAKINAAKVAKVTKKRKGKMVKIALGQTKQADLVSEGDYGAGAPAVVVAKRGGGTLISGGNAIDNPYPYSSGGWTVNSDGIVTVPTDPSVIGIIDITTQTGSNPSHVKVWELEVVCIDGEIRIAPVAVD